MKYNFDEVIDRRNTNCIKYDGAKNFGLPEDILPLWVADMDFRAPEEVKTALAKIAEFNIYGYSEPANDAYFNAVKNWMKKHHDWEVEKEWLVKSPGIVFAISAAIRAFTEPGEGVLIQEPVYYPFRMMIEKNGRKTVSSELVLTADGKYEIDFADFENKIQAQKVKLFVLCSPHNPVGRVWKAEELQRMGEICKKYGVLVVSDEIHAEFTYPGVTHQVFSCAGDAFADFSVICTAPSKAFNLAGLQTSNIFIKNEKLRKKFQAEITKTGYDEINIFGLAACQAAYEHGAEWLEQLKAYLKGNLDFVRTFLQEKNSCLKLVEPEGTYLIWIDCRALGITDEELKERVKAAGLWLDDGSMFGKAGEGFERINIACPRTTLQEAMERLVKIENIQ